MNSDLGLVRYDAARHALAEAHGAKNAGGRNSQPRHRDIVVGKGNKENSIRNFAFLVAL